MTGSMNGIVVVIGTLAALCTITSFVPQIWKILKERDASSVSLRMYALTVSAFTLWTIYGVMLKAWPLVLANSVSLLLAGTALACKWRFRNGEPDA
ncbi:SemiSWEET transporter [Brevundimonas sp. 2R-24]|uniref:SemiSWEET transporter n=1 Tax=Peiella sedimenti TaxID=3061083 RepID=A0ABT8SP53_9CAUL|nr:SemiSWEET transporter [Caulobacteraceae bacterium XZ-24]